MHTVDFIDTFKGMIGNHFLGPTAKFLDAKSKEEEGKKKTKQRKDGKEERKEEREKENRRGRRRRRERRQENMRINKPTIERASPPILSLSLPPS